MAFPLQKTFLCSNGQSFPCSNGRSTSTLLASDLKFQRFNKPFILRVGSMQIRNSSKEHPRVSSAAVLPPVPRSIHDIPNGDHILGFGANLAEDHPGYHDEEYKRRRSCIADLAKKHKIGEPIPEINYTTEEAHVWAEVLTKLSELYPSHACKEYLESFPLFNFSPNKIPQLEELSQVLQHYTGWKIRPVAGLLHPRQFLNGLAFKTFHSTQYIRHTSNPMYTPEPDICHEILGHMPMLVHPEFADLAQVIGLASLGASDKEIWHLTKLYWYTVEFGTIEENKEVKAFGAGILSSFGELQHMKSSKPTFQNLDPFAQLPKMSYKDGFQNMYFLCQSFSDTTEKLRSYARTIHSGNRIQQRTFYLRRAFSRFWTYGA